MLLTDEQIDRYSRQIIVREFGGRGQRRLLDTPVLVVGTGAAAEIAALYLTAAGVGTVGLAAAFSEGRHPAAVTDAGGLDDTARSLRGRNRDVCVLTHPPGPGIDVEVIGRYGAAVVLSEEATTARAVNPYCLQHGQPWVWGQGRRFDGQLTTFVPGSDTACYACVYPTDAPAGLRPHGREAALFPPLAALLGALAATEVVKVVAGIGTPLVGRMLSCATDTMRFSEVRLGRDPHCAVCKRDSG